MSATTQPLAVTRFLLTSLFVAAEEEGLPRHKIMLADVKKAFSTTPSIDERRSIHIIVDISLRLLQRDNKRAHCCPCGLFPVRCRQNGCCSEDSEEIGECHCRWENVKKLSCVVEEGPS